MWTSACSKDGSINSDNMDRYYYFHLHIASYTYVNIYTTETLIDFKNRYVVWFVKGSKTSGIVSEISFSDLVKYIKYRPAGSMNSHFPPLHPICITFIYIDLCYDIRDVAMVTVCLPSCTSSLFRRRVPSTNRSSPWLGFRYLYSFRARRMRAGRRALMALLRFWDRAILSLTTRTEIDPWLSITLSEFVLFVKNIRKQVVT